MRINARLNSHDITNVIRELGLYKAQLQWRLERFLSELAEVGITVARANTYVEYDEQYINMGDLIEFSKPISIEGEDVVCTLTAQGQLYTKEWKGGSAQVNPLLMAEFGSGANAIEGHRGTFPNQHVAFLNSWNWTDNSGQKHESSGSVPSRPMLKAKEEMEQQIQEVAQRVFSE